MSKSSEPERGPQPAFPSYYEICVDGRLSHQGASWFEEMTCGVNEETLPPQTILRGKIADAAALYGLISRLRDLGLILVSIQRLVHPPRA